MKAALFAIGGILSGWLLKFLKFLGGVVLRGLGTILSFFGLYVPVIYLLFGLVLNIAFKFNPFGGDVNGKLYVLGLVECLICTLNQLRAVFLIGFGQRNAHRTGCME